MSEFILTADGITKNFPGVRALDNVDFDLRPGEVHALLGENGAGKSTLVKILTGVYGKDQGTIKVNGQKVDFQSPLDSMRLGISVIHQELSIAPHLDVGRNIFLGRFPTKWGGVGASLGLIDWKLLYKNAGTVLNELAIDINPRQLAGELTTSKAQMVEIARALSMENRIIFMDEPTSSLSQAEQEELFEKIHQLKAKGVSIVYISHRLEEILQISDRITVLRDGKKIATVNASEASIDSMVSMIVGHETHDRYPKKHVDRGEVVFKVHNLSRTGTLNNISFELHRGEILGFAGLVGSGRTELARAIFGADTIDSGQIWINGKEVRIRSTRDAMNYGMAFLTEDRKKEGLLLNQSIFNNLITSAINCDRVIDEYTIGPSTFGILDFVTLRHRSKGFIQAMALKAHSLQTEVQFLSGGNQQKAVIAKWLMTHSTIFIFDEPTRGIDVGTKPEVYRLMEDLAEKGAAVIMISSELPEVVAISDRILVMCQGEIVAEFSHENADEQTIMRHAASKVMVECGNTDVS
jgi:ribose transport system ATP-binding protein